MRQIFAAALLLAGAAYAQPQPPAPTPQPANVVPCNDAVGGALQAVPEIPRNDTTKTLTGTILTTSEMRKVTTRTGALGTTNVVCKPQRLRVYKNGAAAAAPAGTDLPEATPGPTLRARVGDLVQLALLNQINKNDFLKSDTGCDQTSLYPYPFPPPVKPGDNPDTFPDCFALSTLTNMHFHGTHVSPSSTGDNVFVEVLPSPRNADGSPVISAALVAQPLADVFNKCATQLDPSNPVNQWPHLWGDLPQSWTKDLQEKQMTQYAPAQWAVNTAQIQMGAWPQYSLGAYPYCYRIPQYTAGSFPPATAAAATSAHAHGAGQAEMDTTSTRPLMMGQAPGTHWYHAHKHGSTTINVLNGMTGAFIIEGQYDDEINAHYKPGRIQQWVMVVNQIGSLPNMEFGGGLPNSPTDKGPDFSVNGRLRPTLEMKKGEVQWWRVLNTSSRAGLYLAAPPAGMHWRQLAQDGVQLNNTNYGNSLDKPILLTPGNRADLLVQLPANATNTSYPVVVYNTVNPSDRPPANTKAPRLTLLTVNVNGSTTMDFPATTPATTFPPFLQDIADGDITGTKVLKFSSSNNPNPPTPAPPITAYPTQHMIDGKKFDGEVGAVVLLNRYEEWKIVSETYASSRTVSHPFHIHINPFQVTEVFSPTKIVTDANGNAILNNGKTIPKYIFKGTTPNPNLPANGPTGQCILDPNDQSTWKPCANDVEGTARTGVWWDVFPIPMGIQQKNAQGVVTASIPGYFKMRSRFVDFSGYYVLHCHILAHEDRGMMTVVEVAPLQSPYSHH